MQNPASKDKKTACLEDLRARILAQDIAPGADLDEAALCEVYGLSRTPMREIFQRLSGEGYVVLEQNKGAKAASMDLGTMRMFFQTAPMVYANIARLAAENRRESELDALRHMQDAFRRATDAQDAGQAALYNHQFHAQIGVMAHNPYLVVSLNRMLIDHTRLSQTFYRPTSTEDTERVRQAVTQHEAMIEAITLRDAAQAVALTIDHWNLTSDRLERYVRPDPLPIDVFETKDNHHAI